MQIALMTMSSARSTYSLHTHNEWEICVCVEGVGVYNLGGQSSPFCTGSVYLCPPGVAHCREEAQDDSFRDLLIRFNDEGFLAGFAGGFCRDDANGSLASIAKTAYHLYNEDSVGNEKAIEMLVETFCRLVMGREIRPELTESVAILRDEINSRFLDPEYKVADSISGLGYNGDYMRRLFKQELGRTPSDYLTEKRLENAKKLLSISRSPELTVAEIAYICGFYDSNYFTRVFKKVTGVLPTAYRKNGK